MLATHFVFWTDCSGWGPRPALRHLYICILIVSVNHREGEEGGVPLTPLQN